MTPRSTVLDNITMHGTILTIVIKYLNQYLQRIFYSNKALLTFETC